MRYDVGVVGLYIFDVLGRPVSRIPKRGNDAQDCARFFLDRGVPHVALTMGEEGSLIATRDGFIDTPALPVAVVDTTGCGDAYDAGFIAALNQDWDLETCGRFATAAASLVATGLGSDSGIRSFEHTLDVMQRGRI